MKGVGGCGARRKMLQQILIMGAGLKSRELPSC